MAKIIMQTGLARVGSASGTILFGIVLARTLTKVEFGLYSFCIFVLMILSMLSRYGLESVLLRYGGAAWHSEDKIRFRGYCSWAMKLTLRNAIIVATLSIIVLLFIGSARWSGVPTMICMMISLPAWSLLYTISYIFKAAYKTPTSSLFEIGTVNHLTLFAVLGLAFFGLNVSALYVAAIMFVCSLATCVFGLVMLKANDLWPQMTELLADDYSEFVSTCNSVVAIMVVHMMANTGGVFLLGLFWGSAEVAKFSAPLRLATATILLTTIVASVIAPRLSGLYNANESEQFKQLLRRGGLAVCGVNIPLLAFIAIGAPWVMLLMGPKYVDAWPLLSLIAIGQIIGSTACLAPTVVCMTGNERVWSIATACIGAFCVALTAILCYFSGAIGAAIGSAVYQASQNWVAACIFKRKYGYWPIPSLASIGSTPKSNELGLEATSRP